MAGTAFVTGGDRGLGLSLCAGLVDKGWQVFAGQYMPAWPALGALAGQYPERLHVVPLDVGSSQSVQAAAQAVAEQAGLVDLLINNAGILSKNGGAPIREAQDYEEMLDLYDVNTLGPLRMVQAFLPLLGRGALRRLCFVSSEAGSIARSERTGLFGYCMSKAALNMQAKILFNDLRPLGFTFRVYHPGWIRSYMHGEKDLNAHLEPEEAAARAIPFFLEPMADEDSLALYDFEGNVWPW